MGRRALIAVLTAAVAVGATAGGGATFGAFTGQTSNSGSSFVASASFGARFVRTLGSAMCEPTSSTVTVPAGGVPAGATVVVFVGTRGAGAYATVSDSKGNVYTPDAQATGGSMRTSVVRTRVSTALVAGDSITASYPLAEASGMTAVQLADVAAPPTTDARATDQGSGTSPSLSVVTTQPRDILIGAVSVQNLRPVTDPAGWSMVGDLNADCGSSATAKATFHAAYQAAPTAQSWSYRPAYSTSDTYSGGLVAYRR